MYLAVIRWTYYAYTVAVYTYFFVRLNACQSSLPAHATMLQCTCTHMQICCGVSVWLQVKFQTTPNDYDALWYQWNWPYAEVAKRVDPMCQEFCSFFCLPLLQNSHRLNTTYDNVLLCMHVSCDMHFHLSGAHNVWGKQANLQPAKSSHVNAENWGP